MRAIRVIGLLWNVELSVCMRGRRAGLRYLAFLPVNSVRICCEKFPSKSEVESVHFAAAHFQRSSNSSRPAAPASEGDGKAAIPLQFRHGFHYLPLSGRAGHSARPLARFGSIRGRRRIAPVQDWVLRQ